MIAQQIFLYSSYIYAREFEKQFFQLNFSETQSRVAALISADLIASTLKLPFEIRKQLL